MADLKFKSKVRAQGGLALPAEALERALTIDAAGEVKSSAVTSTELGYLSGATSSIQGQLNLKASQADLDLVTQDVVDLVTLSGVAANSTNLGTFTGTIIPDVTTIKGALQALEVELESIPTPFFYAGNYDAALNSPNLTTDPQFRISGAVYHTSVAGTQDFGAFGGVLVLRVGDKVIYNGVNSVYEKWDVNDADIISDQITEGTVNLFFTNERAQDAVGAILVDTASVDLTYDDALGQIKADVLPAGVNHDLLLNFVANEHVDHSLVEIQTGVNSGLAGGGNITTTRSLSVDIGGTTALGVAPELSDEVLIRDVSAGSLRKVTVGQILEKVSSVGDIDETSFSIVAPQATPANVTGFAFSALVVRGFKALVTVEIDATLDLFETFELVGVNKGGSFEMAQSSVGDETGVVLSITAAGQVQYTSASYAGFVSGSIKFRAITLTV